MHYLPSPPQGVWYLGPLPVRAYALCIIVGILAALWLTRRRYADESVVYDAAMVIIPAGIIGGRLYHVITDADQYFCDTCNPVDALKITNGGLGIWGAVILGVFAVWVMMRRKGLPMGPLADAIAPGLILAQGIGRLGNWFNQELYGRPTTLPWGLEIYRRVDEAGNFAPLTGRSTGEVIAVVQPTFLYELVWNVAVCIALLWISQRWKDLAPGSIFAMYVIGYTFGRFFIELLRSDPATMILGMRVNTITSALLFVLGWVALWLLNRKKTTPITATQEQESEHITAKNG